MSKTNFGNRLIAILITILVTGLIGAGINYLALPAMTFHSSGFWWFWLVIGIIAAIVYFVANGIVNKIMCDDGGSTPGWIICGVVCVWLVIFVITAITGSKMVNAKQYSNIIDVQTGNFQDEIAQINPEDLVIVDVKTAQKLGDRTIGTIKNASWYDVDDEYNLVTINGEAYRISPINYGNLWKYFKADASGIPGYVLVNAKNQEAKYVELEEAMMYSPSACFSYDLTRHLRNLYPSYLFGKTFFEVDDSGKPFWITSVKTVQIGMRGGWITTSVLVTDAVTGNTEEYDLDKIPEWIDHVDSVAHLMQVIDWHYSYWDGWWNSVTSKTQVYKTAYFYKDQEQNASENENKSDLAANEFTPFEGYNSIITEEGKVMFYTGLTPANNAETNIGFLLIDPRTHEATYYEATGAEESSAQGAVEGLVSDLRYSASFPTIVNVDGVETYFMVLKDGAGLIQRYAFSNVANYAKCVQAETIEEALKAYKIEIGLISEDEGNKQTSHEEEPAGSETQKPEVETKELSGTVLQIKEAQIDGYTYYYFTIEESDMIFMSSIENSNMQPMKLLVGNMVIFKYYESTKEDGIGIVTAIKFAEY